MTAPGATVKTRTGISFLRLLTLRVRHDYFKDGGARDLEFSPLGESRAFLAAQGVRTRADGEGFDLAVEADRLPALWDERLEGIRARCLEFLVLSRDPLAQVYTAPGPGLPVFGPAADADSTLQPLDSPDGPPPELRRSGPPGLPLALLRLPLVPPAAASPDAWISGPQAAYTLHLEARSTLWKYLLLGDWSGCTPRLADSGGAVDFGDPEAVVLENGAPALAIRSLRDIALREHPPQRFQLKDASANPERVLIKRLPAAAPGRFHRETVDGVGKFVSEIFIHR